MARQPLEAKDVQRLARRAREGEVAAFRELVESYQQAIYGLAYRYMGNADDADDMAQETFVRAWQALDRYDEKFSLYTWLRTIVTRLCINEIEKRKRRNTESGETFDNAVMQQEDSSVTAHERLEGNELQERVQQALKTLPASHREVLVLRTYEELSYDEIASELGVAKGTVMSRLHRARKMLRQALEASLSGWGVENEQRREPQG